MIKRCHNPKNKRFEYYGARGIMVCDRWRGDGGFENFLVDMGRKPTPKHSIERKDNSLGYAPDNCIWATRSEQMRNTRRTVRITIGAETLCLKDWAERLGVVSYKTAHWRVKAGWDPELAVQTPTGQQRPAHSRAEGNP